MQGAVIFFGPPGAGKTTHGKLLAETFGALHIEASSLIQEAFTSGRVSDLLEDGTRIDLHQERRRFENGELNDSRWVIFLVKRTIIQAKAGDRGVVFSSGMRKRVEAEAIMPVLDDLFGREQCVAIFLDVSEDVAAARLQERGRAMDQHASRRFQQFRQETLPVLNYLSDHWSVPLIQIVNTQPIPFVQRVLQERIEKHFGGKRCTS